MGEAETEVDRLKRLTLDLLGGSQQWLSFADIAAEHYAADGDIDRDALADALVELLAEDKIEQDADEYRWLDPAAGDGGQSELAALRAEVDRLRAENDSLRERCAAAELAKEKVDQYVSAAAKVIRLRAEQAADRAAVVALVDMLPLCDEPGCLERATCGYSGEEVLSAVRFCDARRDDGCVDRPEAAELRALLERMKTWEEAK
jgi:hypothetical protein